MVANFLIYICIGIEGFIEKLYEWMNDAFI